MLWQQRYSDTYPAAVLGGVGVLVGAAVGLFRSITYHNRLLCYRVIPAARRHRSKGLGRDELLESRDGDDDSLLCVCVCVCVCVCQAVPVHYPQRRRR